MLDQILINYPDVNFILYDEFEDAVIGVEENEYRIIYSKKKILEILTSDGTSYEEAIDHYGYNILGTYAGEHTPILCNDVEL